MTRDITPPMRDPEPRVRGGMTTRDPEAWAREVNTTGDHDKVRRARALRDADAVGLHVERAVAAGWDFARALDAFGQRLDGESAGRLRQHWIYGERFWAWWQQPAKNGLRVTANLRTGEITEAKPAPARNVPIRVGDYVYCGADQKWLHVASVHAGYVTGDCGWSLSFEGVTDHRPAPRITLPDGREVTPDRMWRYRLPQPNGTPNEFANIDGGAWQNKPDGWMRMFDDPWRDSSFVLYTLVWPPAECEGA